MPNSTRPAPSDWSRIERLQAARDRADRVCRALMVLLLPTLLTALLFTPLFWRITP